MTVSIASDDHFPESVWDASTLRGLDERGRKEIEAAGRLKTLRDGEVLFRAGDPADSIFVVVSGTCALFGIRRGDAEVSLVRRVRSAEVLGEDAIVFAFSARRFEARCDAAGVVAEIPFVVFKRAIVRAGGASSFERVERTLRRASTLDLFRSATFTRSLPEGDIEVLLDASRHVEVGRGEYVYREGDDARDAYLIADGLVQLQTSDNGNPRIEAYLGRGDLFGEDELAEHRPRSLGVVASGPAWVVAIPRGVFLPLARRNPDLLDVARRVRSEEAVDDRRLRPAGHTTAHVFRDLYRMRVARSLLVIDQDSCIRCGHCAWSCASVHEDGVSRLVRRGETLAVSERAEGGREAERRTVPLLVPNSCQHCKNPSCMIGCPTGAIGRDARGEVFIREDLCTGCGNCEKACPWDNIQMAPRKDDAPFAAVAVKCDLCTGKDGGPACVSSCPTQAIARIDPNEVLSEVGLGGAVPSVSAIRPIMPRRIPAWPWTVGSVLAGAGLALIPIGRWGSGIVGGVLLALLVGYSAGKRVRSVPVVLERLRARVPLSRWLYVAHLALGGLVTGVVVRHVSWQVSGSVGGALAIVFALAVATGVLGATISAVVPRALSRVERKSVLPEELDVKAKQLDEEIFSVLSGKTELVKALFVTALGPYRRAVLGPFWLLASRRNLREEERLLRSRIDTLTGGKTGTSMAGIDEVVRLVVEHRAVRLQRALTSSLRGWIVPHVAATAVTIVLLVLHVVAVIRR